ncbi:PREDICTED: GATA zinc finger domain-containing protein 14 [Ceratosolen solmsi marchali]|uniref:GATA zinc finger domain-containing protein 14 n=1 Tax=Ceratosolen solmsi marchali TaxID=326594 RepID=A0AAJ7E160_9HYME|nr:PREDICTED: GATA zinc finger domain-containing protein 14 [Ceratosolen solmsi marchali]
MWLRYSIFMYSITHALATEILYDTKDFSSSSKNNSNDVLHSLYFVSNNKKINEQQSIRTTKSSDFQLTESVINDILISNQQGRNLNNYAAIYDDPEVKNVLKLKNNTLSRTYIQNKLCSLGLMNCNNLNESDPQYLSRRDIHPQDNVYIQSVRTKPLSIPVPVIPVNDPENFNDYKPGRIGYNTVFLGLTPPLTSFNIHNLSSFIKQQPLISSSINPTNEQSSTIYNVKPVYEIGFDKDFNYDNKFINKKEIIIQPDSNIQQHIHHHFHHNDAKEGIVPIIGSGLINNNAFNNNGHENIGSLYNYYEEHKKKNNLLPDNSFLGDSLNNNYADRYHLYGNLKHDSVLNKINIQRGLTNNKNFSYKIEPLNKFNNYYGNKNFEVSKEFNVNNNFGFNNEFGQKNAAANGLSKTNYNDCICVLYEQCIMLGKAGRKDDLYLAIDPRNLGTNIAADSKDLIKSYCLEFRPPDVVRRPRWLD